MKTTQEIGTFIGRAIARDVLADSDLPWEWTGIDPQDADQIPEGIDREEVERIAEQVYQSAIEEHRLRGEDWQSDFPPP